ncbi:MAG: SAM-dependent methyltransferase [Oceanicaulis sp.]
MTAPARTPGARIAHFDTLFRADADPWGAAKNRPERMKLDAILHALGSGRLARGLELGCGNGAHTAALAARCLHLDALDASPAALARAKARLGGASTVTLHQAAMPARPPRRGVQAVIASEVLYYLSPAALSRQLALLQPALAPGARVIAASAARRHRDFAQSPRQLEQALIRAFGPPQRERRGEGWRLWVWRM